MTDKHRETFREEARELLAELESALLELEKTPEDEDLVGRVFRSMHTIKGSGAMFGFEDIASFTHDVETVYDLVRNREIGVDADLISLTLSACDQIRRMVETPGEGTAEDEAAAQKISAAFRKLLPAVDKTKSAAAPSPAAGDKNKPLQNAESITYRVRFRPAHDIFASGTNPALLLKELCGLGRCTIVANTGEIPPLTELDPEACYTFWDVVLTTSRGVNAIKDVFIFVEDDCELKIDVIDREGPDETDHDYKKLGEILVERGDLSTNDLEKVLTAHKRIGEQLMDAGVIAPEKVYSALAEQQHVREVRQERKTTETTASIRVPAGKLDTLVNLVGELVTVQSRLSQTASSLFTSELTAIAEEVERLTDELRENTLSIRMLPIGTTFSKFNRLVRDLSSELGKDITLITAGAETELDKTVIERLNDPLIHIIRNSIDHGIERPEQRAAAGKPQQGTVRLSAEHSGANVLIRISDDGAGLDADGIRAKAVEKGLLAPDAALEEKELLALIFAPGFSTARKITSVSGRGVGMDVVKRNIDALQGTIAVATERGAGTTITLKLPLTLAIIDGLLVKIGAASFILPLSFVDECVELTERQIADAHGRHLANIRGDIVPYVRLRERFAIGGVRPAIEQIVTTRVEGQRVGLVVDQVVGDHQTVIKPLGRIYRGVEEASGATILGDGRVALIIDIPKLVQQVEKDEFSSEHSARPAAG
jgi:two-component system chemotaxis sensor kinase CheA